MRAHILEAQFGWPGPGVLELHWEDVVRADQHRWRTVRVGRRRYGMVAARKSGATLHATGPVVAVVDQVQSAEAIPGHLRRERHFDRALTAWRDEDSHRARPA